MVDGYEVPILIRSCTLLLSKMFMDREALIHFVGGAMGGTTGTCLTCPLEVIKTRMQSSKGISTIGGGPSTSQGASSHGPTPPSSAPKGPSSTPYKHFLGNELRGHLVTQHMKNGGALIDVALGRTAFSMMHLAQSHSTAQTPPAQSSQPKHRVRPTIVRYMAHVIQNEGIAALYKGLVPNLIGVAPSKAVYFYTYSTSKRLWNESGVFLPNSAIVHMVSAGSAGFVAASAVNPIWLVKTRLQLHQGKISIWEMVKRVHKREGFKGFYKGVTASYAGVSETMIQFVIYEQLRSMLLQHSQEDDKRKMDFLNFMVAGGSAKFIACVIAYPHEVVRTRLREESDVKKGFFRTLYGLYNEGGRAMYRGLSVQLLRTVPNTAITMGTYELVVYGLHQL